MVILLVTFAGRHRLYEAEKIIHDKLFVIWEEKVHPLWENKFCGICFLKNGTNSSYNINAWSNAHCSQCKSCLKASENFVTALKKSYIAYFINKLGFLCYFHSVFWMYEKVKSLFWLQLWCHNNKKKEGKKVHFYKWMQCLSIAIGHTSVVLFCFQSITGRPTLWSTPLAR